MSDPVEHLKDHERKFYDGIKAAVDSGEHREAHALFIVLITFENLSKERGLRKAAETRDEFTRGYLYAIGTLLRLHNEPTLAADVLNEIGVRTPQKLNAMRRHPVNLDIDEYCLIIRKMRGWWRKP